MGQVFVTFTLWSTFTETDVLNSVKLLKDYRTAPIFSFTLGISGAEISHAFC